MHGFRKRDRNGFILKATSSTRPAKALKRKETQRMPPTAPASEPLFPVQEDPHVSLAKLQDMLSLTKPVSTLDLKGEEYDDPDLHPVHISKTSQGLYMINTNVHATKWERSSSRTETICLSIMPLIPDSKPLYSGDHRDSSFGQSTLFQPRFGKFLNQCRNLHQVIGGDLKPSEGLISGPEIPPNNSKDF